MKFLFFLLTMALVVWVQLTVNYFGGAIGLSANVVLIAALYFGLSRGPMTGVCLGFVWGLLIDASSLGLIGLNAFLFASAGYMAGLLRRQLDGHKAWTQTIFTLGVSMLFVVLFFVFDRLFAVGVHSFSSSLLVQPLLNAILAPVIFWVIFHWAQLWNMLPRER